MRVKSVLVRAEPAGSPASRKSVLPQQIVSFLLALFIGAGPVASVPTEPTEPTASPVTIARLEVRISTTSPSTQVTLRPGRIAAQRAVTVPDDVKITELAGGWVLNGPGGTLRTVVLRAVFEEPAGAPRIQVAVRKENAGTTDVEVRNTSGKPFLAARLMNGLPGSTNGTKSRDGLTAVLTRTRAQVLGSANPAMDAVDTQRLVLAAYYPWFGMTYDNPQFADRPAEARSTATPAGVLSMTQQARRAGIDGFIFSWQGEEFSGKRFDLALAAARQTGGVVTPYLEMLNARAPGATGRKADPLVVLEWLNATLERAGDPAFLHSGGVPVVFVWQMASLSRIGWLNVLGELARQGKKVRLVGDAPSSYGALQWGVQEYNPNFLSPTDLARHYRNRMLDTRLLADSDEAGPHLYVATVSPGYDDSKVPGRTAPVVPRGEAGERYLASWEAALAAQPDWIMITSWNEWFEGTSVEPSVGHGDLALRQTAEQAARFAE